MKRVLSRILVLALTLCILLSAMPMVFAAEDTQDIERGKIDLVVCAIEVSGGRYLVTYQAGLVMQEELANRAATMSFRQDIMRELRFICTLDDELVDHLENVQKEDFTFDCAQWKGRDIFVYEEARLTEEGLKIYYKLDEQVLADWPASATEDVAAALQQPMTMTAKEYVTEAQMESVNRVVNTIGKMELTGKSADFSEFYFLSHEGNTDLFHHEPGVDDELNHDHSGDIGGKPGPGCGGDHKHDDDCPWVPGSALGDCPRNIYCPAGHFVDLDLQLWYHDGIHYCAEHDLMIGMTGTTFEPYTFINRAMVVTILYRMEGTPAVTGKQVYKDVDPDAWYGKAVEWGTAAKVINGYGKNVFGPLDPITREQMAAILWRYAQYKGYDVSVGENTNILSYHDAFDVSGYAIPAMQWACGAGMIQGANGYLMPLDTTTRAQAAAIIQRYCLNVAR